MKIDPLSSDSDDLPSMALTTAAELLDRFLVRARHALGPDVTALRLHILLNVLANEGINQRKLLNLLDMSFFHQSF